MAKAERDNGKRRKKWRVLVAEDVRAISLLMAKSLGKAGFVVEVAHDGQECLEKARSFRPHLIALDIMMPKMHGIDVMKQLQEDKRTRGVGVIVCTAKSFKTEHAQVEELGAYDILIKPFEPDALVTKVREYFRRKDTANTRPLRPIDESTVGTAFLPRLESAKGFLHLWGTRGSTPTPGALYMRHGGNTSCMSFDFGEHRLIFDAGTGIRDAGYEILQNGPCKIHLFVTHTHWDHIQGFPFFAPAYERGFEITVYGAEGFGKDLRSVFQGQLDRDYFPVQLEEMHAKIDFQLLSGEPVVIDRDRDLQVHWEFVHHPGATVGYKINAGGKRLTWIPDNEMLKGYIGSPLKITLEHKLVSPYLRLIDFLADTDILVHEAQYTNQEYAFKVGWGHSSVTNACLLVKLANIRRWIITHHDPSHDDRFLENKLSVTKQVLASLEHEAIVDHGYDGMIEYL